MAIFQKYLVWDVPIADGEYNAELLKVKYFSKDKYFSRVLVTWGILPSENVHISTNLSAASFPNND